MRVQAREAGARLGRGCTTQSGWLMARSVGRVQLRYMGPRRASVCGTEPRRRDGVLTRSPVGSVGLLDHWVQVMDP
jgi:hypothetical protein